MANFDPADSGYIDVAARIVDFRTKHPDGSLQPADLATPYRVETIGNDTFVVVVAAAYRTQDDPRPGIGMAYEAYPGKTPYTRGSELQNAETSAWGRAIVAALAADTKRGIASADEVRNRQAERDQPKRDVATDMPWFTTMVEKVSVEEDAEKLTGLWREIAQKSREGQLTVEDGTELKELVARRGAEIKTEADRATTGQQQQIGDLWKQAEITDAAAQNTYMSEATGREISSSGDLTKHDAATVIGKLTTYVSQSTPATT